MEQALRTILIVDDTLEDREQYRQNLLQDLEYSYTILETSLGEQGLALWQQYQPDAILLNYRLSDLSGEQFLNQLKTATQQSYLPVTVIIALEEQAIAKQAIAAGAQNYLIKEHITAEALQIAVERAISTTALYKQFQQQKRELEKGQERFRLLVENIEDVFWITEEPSRRVSYVSPAYERLWGLNSQELYASQQNWLKYIHPEDRSAIAKAFQENALVGKFDEEYRICLPNGTIRWVRDRCYPVYDDSGRVCQLTGIAADITESKQAEAEHNQLFQDLANERAQFEAVLRQMPAGVIIANVSGKILLSNQQATEIWRQPLPSAYTVSDYVNYRGFHADGQPYQPEEWPLARSLMTGEIVTREEIHFLDGEGIIRLIEVNSAPIYNERGEITAGVVVFQDISDRKQTERALNRNEERLRLALESAHMGTWDIDLNTGKALWSERHFTMLGYKSTPTGEASELMWYDCLHPEDRERVSYEWQQSRLEHRQYKCEYRIVRPDNQQVAWLAALGSFFYNNDGVAVRSIGVLIDITERKQAEQALQASEERFRLVTQAVNGLIFDWDIRTNKVYRSEKLYELVGVHSDDIPDDSDWWVQRIHPDDMQRLAPEKPKIFAQNLYEAEYRVCHVDGHWVDVWERGHVVRDDQGQVVRVVGSTIDISDRKQTEEALRQSEEKFRQMAESISDIFWMMDIERQKVLYISPAFDQIWGRSREELYQEWRIGFNYIHPEDRSRVAAIAAQALETKGFDMEYRIIRPDGTIRYLRDRCFLIPDSNGKVTRLAGLAQDITERKQAEELIAANESRLKAFVDSNAVGILYGDVYGNINEANDELLRIIGYTREELTTGIISWINLTPPEQLWLDHRGIAEAQDQGACTPYEKEYIRKDGSRVPVLVGYSLVGEVKEETVAFILDLSAQKQAEAELRESEKRFRRLVESNMFGVGFGDFVGGVHYANDYLLNMLGYSRAEVETGQVKWTDITPPEFLPLDAQAGAELKVRGVATPFEKELIRKDGTRVPILIGSALLQEPFEQQQEIIAFFLDLTERKQAEAAWREGKQTLDAIMEYIPEGITIADAPDVTIRRISRYGQQLIGHPPEVIIDIPAAEQVEIWGIRGTDGTQPLPEELPLSRAVQKGEIVDAEEWILQRPDGSQINILCNAGPIRKHNGSITGGVIAWRDITERKRYEETLQQTLQKLTFHVENTPMAVIEWDSELRVTRWSGAATKIFGWEAIEVLGNRITDLNIVFEEDIEKVAEASEQLTFGTESYVFGYNRNYTKQGNIIHCEWYNSSLRDESGQMISVLALVLDVTEQKQAEAERHQLLLQEQKARAEAERANRMKDDFLAILSHELRSPLNPILGWSKLLQTRTFNAKTTAEALATIERNARLQTQLIDDLLDVAKILRGKLSMNAAPVDLAFVIESAIETVTTSAIAKSIHLHSVIPRIGQVYGDAARLQQIVWNLLSNAIKFTPNSGRVEIYLERVDDQAHIIVSDTGKGISPDFLPHIFDSFRQEDSSTTRKYGGLGLGLAIVRSLVEAHGGTISASSLGENQGSTFIVRLPLLNRVCELELSDRLSPQELNLAGIRILAVDDELDNRELLAVILTQHGAEVMTVASATEALACLASFQPQVLISDIGMPDISGYELLKQIRTLPLEQGSQIPAIALTAYAREEDRQQAIKAGFQAHIGKPIDPNILALTLTNLLQQTHA